MIGAPHPLTKEVLDHFRVDVVVRGKVAEATNNPHDPFQVAQERGIFKVRDTFYQSPGAVLVRPVYSYYGC